MSWRSWKPRTVGQARIVLEALTDARGWTTVREAAENSRTHVRQAQRVLSKLAYRGLLRIEAMPPDVALKRNRIGRRELIWVRDQEPEADVFFGMLAHAVLIVNQAHGQGCEIDVSFRQ